MGIFGEGGLGQGFYVIRKEQPLCHIIVNHNPVGTSFFLVPEMGCVAWSSDALYLTDVPCTLADFDTSFLFAACMRAGLGLHQPAERDNKNG